MRILVLGVRGIPGVQGGVETHAEQLYARLARLGCKVEVIVRTPFVPRGLNHFGVIRLRRIWSPRRAGFEALIHSIIGVVYAGIVRPEILHIHGIGPSIVTPIARFLGLRVVVTHHGQDYEREKWGRFARSVLRLGERLGTNFSTERITISRAISDHLRNKFHKDSFLIPNGVAAVGATNERNFVEGFGLEAGKYFLQVSRMVPEKRQLDLIRAYAESEPRGWKLVLAGALDNSDYSKRIAAEAAKAGVILTGFVSGDPLHQLYSHAGGFVLPSSHEGLPIALLEALSYGLPALASNIPANLEVGMRPENYFPLGDIAVLAGRLTELASTPFNAAQRAEVRLWTREKFDWDRIATQTMDVYVQAASSVSR